MGFEQEHHQCIRDLHHFDDGAVAFDDWPGRGSCGRSLPCVFLKDIHRFIDRGIPGFCEHRIGLAPLVDGRARDPDRLTRRAHIRKPGQGLQECRFPVTSASARARRDVRGCLVARGERSFSPLFALVSGELRRRGWSICGFVHNHQFRSGRGETGSSGVPTPSANGGNAPPSRPFTRIDREAIPGGWSEWGVCLWTIGRLVPAFLLIGDLILEPS